MLFGELQQDFHDCFENFADKLRTLLGYPKDDRTYGRADDT